ncbi:hypothetical protein TAMA11512_18870 [Selenomonas sp. TAMA-11512]|uniref:hypothetical protein n=1 Tax=Selenomonas sp. TAMA-11512 TaxID=3095337 RepID=UPI00308E3E55|nr:hypothetical protein TAMA11512_18870 [Selenomonas sp. TAMA-11512]
MTERKIYTNLTDFILSALPKAKPYSLMRNVPMKKKRIVIRQGIWYNEKQHIARYPASLVAAGDVIYLDSGTSTLYITKYLRKKKITVVTSHTKGMDQLPDSAATRITLGGGINKQSGITHEGGSRRPEVSII